ncbi:hypothetical protein HT031_001194 [Scenedesmus sp. PABB004]|nr:hypothetical protein HT031_001194 [Scenedesmus sp. PABB004]
MRAGFLGGPAAARAAAPHHAPAAPAGAAASPPPAPARAAAPAPLAGGAGERSSDAWQQQWRACLELLRSDVDEKKFVGLLLVTKLLPAGRDGGVAEVLDAVGWAFVQRLLLPLSSAAHQAASPAPDDARLQQQHLSAVLGLSILAAACRLPEVARGDEVLSLTPLLLKVAAAGGVAPLLLAAPPPGGGAPGGGGDGAAAAAPARPAWADPPAEAAAAVDALEALLACAGDGEAYPARVLAESGGFAGAVAALAAALRALDEAGGGAAPAAAAAAAAGGPVGGDGAAAARASALQAVMLSTRLLSLVLGGPGDAAEATGQRPADAAAAVMLLARVLGGGLAAAGDGVDGAALQLQAQHALLLLLPLPERSAAAAHLAAAADAAARGGPGPRRRLPPWAQQPQAGSAAAAAAALAGDWPAALRRGLGQVLRSRVGAVQRHSALRLAAAALELLGPAWLLPPAAGPRQPAEEGPEQFLLVLVEVLGVETPLLLSDAMNPDATVPRGDLSMDARRPDAGGDDAGGDGAGGDVDAGSDGDSDDDDAAMQGAPGSGAAAAEAVSVRAALERVGEQGAAVGGAQQGPPGFERAPAGKPLAQQLAELALPPDRPPGPGQQSAGQRAAVVLPACYQLLEGVCEVLVDQVALMEALADLHGGADGGPDGGRADAGAGGAPGGAVWPRALPALEPAQAGQVMGRLQAVTGVLVEFLAAATAPGSGVDALLALGGARALARFLADAPGAHQDALAPLLPALLRLALPGDGGAPAGTGFLLPALLSWTAPSSEAAQHWAGVLLAPGGGCLEALCGFAAAQAAAAAAATAAAAGAGAGADSAGAEQHAAEARLGPACQVLLQLLASVPAGLAPQQAAARLQDGQLAAPAQLLRALAAWGGVRRAQAAAAAAAAGAPASGDDAVAAAGGALAALVRARVGLASLLPAAALAGLLLLQLGAARCAPLAPADADGAAALLAWGCEAGWSCQLVAAARELAAGAPGAAPPPLGTVAAAAAAAALEAWADAELGDAWDACLSATAELLVERLPPAAALAGALRGAPWAAPGAGGGGAAGEVLASTAGLQLLRGALAGAGAPPPLPGAQLPRAETVPHPATARGLPPQRPASQGPLPSRPGASWAPHPGTVRSRTRTARPWAAAAPPSSERPGSSGGASPSTTPAAMASYPAEPFKQADSLLTGLLESYRSSSDASDIADIQSLLETTVKIARDREFKVSASIKELSHKVTELEAAAVYSDAKAAHEARMAQINKAIAEVQLEVQQVSADIRGASDQQEGLKARQQQLQADREQLAELQQVVEPDMLKRISLYAHISGLGFDYATLAQPLLRATVSDTAAADIRRVEFDTAAPPLEAVNALWADIPVPPV